MKRVVQLLTITIVVLSLVACADDSDGSGLTTTVAPLTDAEAAALDACLAEVAGCRLDAAETGELSEECRAIMECLPERPDDERRSGRDWRAFCEGLEARCMGDDVDETLCVELAERCDASALDAGKPGLDDDGPVTQEECMNDCLGAGIGDDLCADRCSDLDNPL